MITIIIQISYKSYKIVKVYDINNIKKHLFNNKNYRHGKIAIGRMSRFWERQFKNAG